jgi:S-DNA-T family DNA segregation ATPase FtsK/SpoIIIE
VAERKLDPEALRAKIKKLPINFAPQQQAKGVPGAGTLREMDLSGYRFPGLDLLSEPESNFTEEMERVVRDQAVQLESALQQYHIQGEVVGIDSGPVITLYEVRLAPGTKVSAVNAVASDLARALKAVNIRVVANMVGKDTVGIEVPNLKKEKVRLKELMTLAAETTQKMALPMFLGKDASGTPLIADLAQMPHMLLAGTTGSGKSVCMNAIIMSFLFTKRPDEMKMVLVDPKMVEMSMFKDVPHLMCPVVTEMDKAAAILEWATTKMDERYELLAEAGVRDIAGYNGLSWDELKTRFQPETEAEEARIPRRLPYMVFIVDELADLIITNKEVEGFIVRLAQKARAVGLHLILATQRPQANVVTGLIKGNMPARISFKVASGLDSRIVLDQKGAEVLLGQGDMLYLSPRTSKLVRSQGTLVDDAEIRRVVDFLRDIAEQNFEPQLVQLRAPGMSDEDTGERDPLFDEAVRIVLETKRGSVSLLQRRLTVGYSRASRLIEQMAQMGLLGEYKGSQARAVTLTLEEWDAMKAQAEADAKEAEAKGTVFEEADGQVSGDEDDEDGGVPDEFDDEYKR